MALRCFVADDHPAIVDSVGRFLDGEDDITVVGAAGDGVEAFARIQEIRPEVAILDVRMPQLTGIEVARRLTAVSSATAVILYTAYAEPALVIEAIEAGARGFVLKDSPLRELVRAVRMVAGGRGYVDSALAAVLAGPETTARIPGLTKRERDVLRLLADGMGNDQIAEALAISSLTVRRHIENAMAKLEADTRAQAVATALRLALIE